MKILISNIETLNNIQYLISNTPNGLEFRPFKAGSYLEFRNSDLGFTTGGGL